MHLYCLGVLIPIRLSQRLAQEKSNNNLISRPIATVTECIFAFCRENEGVSQVVGEKDGLFLGIKGKSPYLCIIGIRIEIHTIRHIS